MTRPIIACICPTYKRPVHLANAVACYMAQDYPQAAAERIAPSRIHRIVDGDTLPALAEKYLGSAQRGPEIFRANRHVLQSPDLLPIGAELTMP